ncbi:hypothetical protein [uncultured Winogradskyella sp.]|uniref:hypothetical protein n=1 Tax=Winogradskyella sp. 4-2091 TaxID=3381659 RepID=UPI00262A273D|nr:hypothetical protein [uncultured Winogradskyella sp.]
MLKLLSKSVIVILLLSLSFVAHSQDSIQKSIVKADSTWSAEIIPFPIEWLPELTFIGFEELRFAPNWNKLEHQEFWTLAMAWQVEATSVISLETITFNFNHYFTELMHPNHWAQEFPDPKLVLNDLDISKSGHQFKGQMTFFDGFHTGKIITVNILGNQVFSEETNTSAILFKLSPKEFDEPIWDELNSIIID